MANRVDPDQMPHCAVSDLGLHCLLRPVYPSLRVIRVSCSRCEMLNYVLKKTKQTTTTKNNNKKQNKQTEKNLSLLRKGVFMVKLFNFVYISFIFSKSLKRILTLDFI